MALLSSNAKIDANLFQTFFSGLKKSPNRYKLYLNSCYYTQLASPFHLRMFQTIKHFEKCTSQVCTYNGISAKKCKFFL